MGSRNAEEARVSAGYINDIFTRVAEYRRYCARRGLLHDVSRADAWMSLIKAELDEACEQAGLAPVLWPFFEEADTQPMTVFPEDEK